MVLQFRQGDILIEAVQTSPLPNGNAETLDRDTAGRPILAYGEKTGHAHVVEVADPEVKDIAIEWIAVGKQRFLESKAEMLIKHDEHRTLSVPAGTYEVVQQQRYTPEAILPSYD